MLKSVASGMGLALLSAPAIAAPAEGSSGGMPQFDFENVAASQVFWLVVIFGILYLLMLAMLPKVAGVTERRAGTISGDLSAAETAKLQAEEKRDAYEASLVSSRSEAQDLIAEAKTDAAKANEARMAEADAAAQARLAEAEKELDAQRTAALTKLDAIATSAAQDTVEKLTGRRPAEDRAAAAVAASQA